MAMLLKQQAVNAFLKARWEFNKPKQLQSHWRPSLQVGEPLFHLTNCNADLDQISASYCIQLCIR